LISFAATLRGELRPRGSLCLAGLLALAFSFVPVVRYEKFNVDSPVAVLNGALLDAGGSVDGARVLLGLVLLILILLFLLGGTFLRRTQLVFVSPFSVAF